MDLSVVTLFSWHLLMSGIKYSGRNICTEDVEAGPYAQWLIRSIWCRWNMLILKVWIKSWEKMKKKKIQKRESKVTEKKSLSGTQPGRTVVRSQLIIPYWDSLQGSQYQDWRWQEGEGLVLWYFPSTTCTCTSEPAQDPHWLLLWVMLLMGTGVFLSDTNVAHWSVFKLLRICCCLCHSLSISRAKAQGHFRHWAATGDGAGVELC